MSLHIFKMRLQTILRCWSLVLASSLTFSLSAFSQTAPTYLWANNSGGNGFDGGLRVGADKFGNTYAAGIFENSASFGSETLISRGGLDVYLVKYNPEGKLVWLRQAGGPGDDAVFGLAVDAAGTTSITGYFSSSSVSSGPQGPATMLLEQVALTGGNAVSEMFVATYSSEGSLQWARQTVGPGGSGGADVAVDRVGNVYVMGTTDGQTRFGQITPSFPASTSRGEYLVKYSAQGSVQWVQTGFGTGLGLGGYYEQVAVDASNQAYTISYAWQPNAALPAGGYRETFLTKLDGSGQRLWTRPLADSHEPVEFAVQQVALSPQGGLWIVGNFAGTLAVGPLRFTSRGGTDVLLLHLDSTGELQWAKQLAGNDAAKPDDDAAALAVDAAGNSYLAASLSDLQTSPPATRYAPIFLLSYKPNGNLRWQRTGPGSVSDLTATATDELVLTGDFIEGESLDAFALPFAGELDGYVAKLGGTSHAALQTIPNIISPNGDGLNDAFRIPELPSGPCQLTIFSRWGTLVYHTDDYQQNWTAQGVPAGRYYYYLRVADQVFCRGWLEVTR
jgi:gliding motility-associated-like protein